MRLIDADYVTEKLNEINGTAELDKAFEVVENAPTVDVLEQISDEVNKLKKVSDGNKVYVGINDVLDIIDKYMKECE